MDIDEEMLAANELFGDGLDLVEGLPLSLEDDDGDEMMRQLG